MAVFESVKAASDIYSPAGGEIIEVNNALLDDLTAITPESAMANWLFKIKINEVIRKTAIKNLTFVMNSESIDVIIK